MQQDLEKKVRVSHHDENAEAEDEKDSLLPENASKTRSIDTEVNFNSWIYDLIVWGFSVSFDIFFREIRPRGAYRIPRHGPVIFVGAPHANQFVDPMLLMRQIRAEAGRRISFLIAEKSMRVPIVGSLARAVSAIPVIRVQDLLVSGKGKVYIENPEEPLRIKGKDTKFTTECAEGGLIALSKSLGSAEIVTIVSDDELILKKGFKSKDAIDFLTQEPRPYKRAPKVDQSQVYKEVFNRLNQGGCIGIFPEGGSHDRPDLLPLKAGVAIMALGALEHNPECDIKIVPCGMNYFHPQKFRSRAVVEFGPPLSVPKELVEMYKQGDKKDAIKQLLDMVHNALLAVTVTCPDYDTLMAIQTARRLYRPAHKKIPLSLVVEMNRRLVKGYTKYKDDPRIIHLRESVAHYNKQLQNLGILDHQVEYATLSTSQILGKLIYRSSKLIVLALGALPGAILFAPVFYATKKYSNKKAREALRASTVKIAARDVMATWKILVAMVLAPALYWTYALLATWLIWRYDLFPEYRPVWLFTIGAMIVFPVITFAALRIGEVGMDIFKSLKPLVTCLNPSNLNSIAKLRITREELSREVTEMINSLGPDVFPEFEARKSIFW
ncbi:hypothetical protein V1511DRAFT_461738 [Dipodascopsis uninucleata]